MKYSISLLFAVSVSLTACTDYIDIDTENSLDINAVDYSKTGEMYQPVVGAYYTQVNQGIHWANAMLWMGRDDDMSSGRADDQGDALKFGYPGGYLLFSARFCPKKVIYL